MPNDTTMLHSIGNRMDGMEKVLSEMAVSIQRLAAAEIRNSDTSNDLKVIRAKLQQVAEVIASSPTKDDHQKLVDKVSDMRQRVTATESKQLADTQAMRADLAGTTRLIYAVGSLVGTALIAAMSVYLNH